MATLTSLAAQGVLVSVTVPLDHGELSQRSLYGFPNFPKWLADDLPNLETGRLQAVETPQEQLDDLFYRWIAGKRIVYGKMFKDLMPQADEVWEFKTVDIRIFGWIYVPCVFIAVFGDYADDYKGRNAGTKYQRAINRVKDHRNGLDLDEPKFATGAFDDLIRV